MHYLVIAYKPHNPQNLLTEKLPKLTVANRWADLMERNGFVVKDVQKVTKHPRRVK